MKKETFAKLLNEAYQIYEDKEITCFEKMDISQFEIFKFNFFERTSYTVFTVLKTLELTNSQEVMENLKEELGFYGGKSHKDLMLNSFDSVSKRMGTVADKRLLPTTKNFISIKKNMLSSSDKDLVLGNFLAHEMAADNMLKNIKKKFFANEDDLSYFTAHSSDEIDGEVEKRHFEDAFRVTLKYCIDLDAVLSSALDFFHAQLLIWREFSRLNNNN